MASTSEYWVGDVIGEGSFGVVVYGRYKQCGTSQQNDQLHVAIKCIDKNSLHRQPSIAMAVIQEQRLLKRLKQQQHTPSIDVTKQNDDTTSGAGSATTTTNSSKKIKHNRNFIVDLYASFHDAECVYLVLECCSGGTLQDVLDHFKSMKETSSKTNHQTVTLAIDDDNDAPVSSTTRKYLLEATQYYGKQLILGISFVHASSIIHCDIKPSNILLTNCGCIKISDFGCSIDLLNNNASIQTKAVVNDPNSSSPSLVPTKSSGWVMLPRGTAAYAAPELNRMSQSPEPPRQQNTDNADIFVAPTFAVDLWSLGCILYACLLVESHQQSPFDKGSEAMSIKGQKEYCDIKETDARYTSLFGKGLLDEDNTDKESVLLPAFKDMIAALLSPKAEERIKFANSERQTKSENIELTSSLHQQNESSSVINVAGNPDVTYPNLQRNIVWDTDEATHTQPQPVRTDFLPPIPSWWIKNSAALTPPKSTAVSGHESSDDSTTNVLMDGAIGWSAFLV